MGDVPISAFGSLNLTTLPGLPDIKNPTLKRLVFTHKSVKTAVISSARDRAQHIAAEGDYEKLAHVGDALLGAAVVLLLHDLYPKLSPEGSTSLKAKLVDKKALSTLSKHYDLPSQLRVQSSVLTSVSNGERNVAEIFEAYLAGLFYDRLDGENIDSLSNDLQTTSVSSSPGNGNGDTHTSSIGNLTKLPGFAYAFQQLVIILFELHTPLAEVLYDPKDTIEEEEDLKAAGALSEFYTFLGKRKIATPDFFVKDRLPDTNEGKDESGRVFDYTCVISHKGRVFSGSATRKTEQSAKNVAAWKILSEMKVALK